MTAAATEAQHDGVAAERLPWWLHPAWLLAVCGGIPALAALLATPAQYAELWRTAKFFTIEHFGLTLLMLAAALVGVAFGANPPRAAVLRVRRSLDDATIAAIRRYGMVFFALTVLGYVAWWFVGVLRGATPDQILSVLAGQPGALTALKGRLRPVAGVTTFTQFGPVAVACLTLVWRQRADSRVRLAVLVIFAMASVRTVAHAERLAILEVIVPWAVVSLAGRPLCLRRASTRAVVALAPVVAPLLVVAIFGVFEYFRSWSNYYSMAGERNYASFTINRMTGYYTTASNNSALVLEDLNPRLPLPYHTLQWLWESPPVMALGGYSGATTVTPTAEWKAILAAKANPEFNNEGGFLVAIGDFGVVGAGCLWLAMGFVLGWVYRQARMGRPEAFLAYAVVVVGMLELGRYVYWSLGRSFPVLVAIAFVALRLRDLRRVDA